MAESRRIKVGDKVWIRWYPRDVIGEVLEVYGPRGNRHVLVRVPSMGPSGEVLYEEETTYRLDKLRLVGAEAA